MLNREDTNQWRSLAVTSQCGSIRRRVFRIVWINLHFHSYHRHEGKIKVDPNVAWAIPELVRDGQTGLLVEERDPVAFAGALEALITNPARRRALGQAGQARVAESFGVDANLEPLARKFGLPAGANRVLRSA